MQIYLKYITELVNSNPEITSLAVWTNLCEKFSSYQSQHPFHQPAGCYLHLARSFAVVNPERCQPNFLQNKLNEFFNLFPLEPTHEFIIMLQAFLICYPQNLSGLQEDIANRINVRPFHLPFLLTDIKSISSTCNNEYDFKQKLGLLVTSPERFTTCHLAKIFLQLNDFTFVDQWEKQSYAMKLLLILWKKYPDNDLEKIVPIMLDNLVNRDIYRVEPLVEIVNLENFDFTRLEKHLTEKFHSDNVEYKKSIMVFLQTLVDKAPTQHIKILALLRSLLLVTDLKTQYQLLILLCKISADVTEIAMHLPALYDSLQSEDKLVQKYAIKALEACYLQLQKLADNSASNRAILLTLLQPIVEKDFFSKCKALILMSKIGYDPVEMATHLLALLAKLQNANELEMLLAVEAISELCQHCTMHVPAVIAALNKALRFANTDVQAMAADALAVLSSKVNADFRCIVPNLLTLLGNSHHGVSNCATSALGQVLIANNPEVPMASVLAKIVKYLHNPMYKYGEEQVVNFIGEIALFRTADYRVVVNSLIAKIKARKEYDFDYQYIIIALGKIAKVQDIDLTIVIPVLMDCFIKEEHDLYDSAIEALTMICEKDQNTDLVVQAFIKTIATVHWSWVAVLARLLNNFMDSPLPINFDYWIDHANSFFKGHDDEAHSQAFELLRSFCKRPEVDKTKILLILLKCIHDSDYDIRRDAVYSLAQVEHYFDDTTHLVIIAALKTCLHDKENYVRDAAFSGLSAMSKRLVALKKKQDADKASTENKEAVVKNDNKDSPVNEVKSVNAEKTSPDNKRKFMERESNIDSYFWSGRGRGRGRRGRARGGMRGSISRSEEWVLRPTPQVCKRQRTDDITSVPEQVPECLADTAVTALLEAIGSESAEVRDSALHCFKDTALHFPENRQIIVDAFLNQLGDTRPYMKERSISALAEIAIQDEFYLDVILPALVEKLSSEYLSTRKDAVSAIVTLAKVKLTDQQKDYLVYGLLLPKLHTTEHPLLRMAILETIEVVSRQRELDFYLQWHLKSSDLVAEVKTYLRV
jgi:hypothetical protein